MWLCNLLLMLVLTVQRGQGSMYKEEAAWRGALNLLQSGQTQRAVGQLNSIFSKMKEEIVYLRGVNGINDEEDQWTNVYGNDLSSDRSPRQWTDLNSTSTTTTTRRPKTTRAPEVKTLTTKEQELHDAAINGWDVTVASLCAEGINANAADASNQGVTPLHLATRGRFLTVALTLIRCGANVNGADLQGNTPLHDAVTRNDNWMTGLLLLAKASPAVSNRAGVAPYQLAASVTDQSIKTMFNTTRLGWLGGARRLTPRERQVIDNIRNGYYLEVVNMCMNGTFDPNVADIDSLRNTALHVAALTQLNHPMIVQALYRCGGHVNAINVLGNTPLHLSIIASNGPAAASLLLHGADPFISNRQGQTAFTLGQQSTNTYIKALFTYPRFEWYLNNMLL